MPFDYNLEHILENVDKKEKLEISDLEEHGGRLIHICRLIYLIIKRKFI